MLKTVTNAAVFTALFCLPFACQTNKTVTYIPLNYATAVDMGKIHNDMVLRMVTRYNNYLKTVRVAAGDQHALKRQICIDELKATPIDVSDMGVTREQFDELFITMTDDIIANNMDIRNVPGYAMNPEVAPYAIEILDATALPTLDEQLSAYAEIRERAELELGASRANDEVQVIAEIADGSSRLWEGDEPGYPILARSKAEKAILADVSAATGAFVRMGVLGVLFASTPPANAIIAANMAVGIGFSSGMAALLGSERIDVNPGSTEK